MRENAKEAIVPCVAGVLAGGRSRRMGHPKALLPLPDGRTLIEHVVGIASDVVPDVVILGRGPTLPTSLGHLPVLPDAEPDGGPLAGLCSLLDYAQDRWGLLIACDMPYLRGHVVRRVLSGVDAEVDAVAFLHEESHGTYHACCALFHPRILPAAIEELTKGKASLQNVLRDVRAAALRPTPDEARQLTNVNTPEDHVRVLGND